MCVEGRFMINRYPDAEKDFYVLMKGMFSTQLPPLLDEILTEKALKKLYDEISDDKTTFLKTIYKINDFGLLECFNGNMKGPKNIYNGNKASEAIRFYTIKKNGAWRPLSVANIKHSLMFSFNNLLASQLF